MPCELRDDAIWPALLTARSLLAAAPGDLVLVQREDVWTSERADVADLRGAAQVLAIPDPRVAEHDTPAVPERAALTLFSPRANGTPAFVHPHGRPVDAAAVTMARVYVPVLLGAAAAHAQHRVFVAAHVTQTLDGRIACTNGQSKWIGNDADLRHAHRMRALLDGVMIGAGTALADDPQLNVRHVTGPDPRRIVLSGRGRVLHQGCGLRLFTPPGCEVVVADELDGAEMHPSARLVKVRADAEGLSPPAVLAALRARGIHSVYLEGGSVTMSSFLRSRCIDLLQVHIAAMVLGSGVPGFALPEVEHVRDAVQFAMDHAMLEDHVLLSCWPVRTAIV